MKKLGLIALALVFMFSLTACRGGQRNETTAPTSSATTAPTTTAATTAATTAPTTHATTEPTSATNIPDPDVDPNSTDGTGNIGGEASPDSGTGNGMDATGGSAGESSRSNRSRMH